MKFRFPAALATILAIGMMVAAATGRPAHAAAPAGGVAQDGTRFDSVIADAKAMMLIDPSKAVARASLAETLAGRLDGRRRLIGIATAQWLQGEAYLRLNDSTRAAPLIDRAIRLVNQAGKPTKLNGDLLLSRGGLHTSTGGVAAALDDYQKAHNIFRDIGETRSQAIALLSIALLYQEAEDYRNALKYYDQALDVYRGDPQILYAIYNNRANALKELGRVNAADGQLRTALEIARQQKSPAMEARVLSNIARGQLVAGQLALADRTIAQGFALTASDEGAVARNQFWVLAASSAFRKGRRDEAVRLIARSFDGVDPTKTTLEMREGHKAAYEIFRRVGEEGQALVHLEALKRLDDQTSRLAASANTSLVAARFDFANQKTRIAQLKADELQRNIDFERARAATRQNIAIGIAIVVMVIVSLLAFGIVTLRRSRDQVRHANIDLAATNTALAKALAAKTEFLATTSHEIRTPLNGILGMTQVMLTDRTLTAALRDRIGVVHGAGITMRALVDDILDVAKMETGNLTIEQVPFDLQATLRDVAKLWQEQASARGIQFVLEVDGGLGWVQGDAARLRQIVFNLLSNALKFTERGTVTLRAASLDDRLSIAVIDSGIGIPAEKHDLIFESFRQVDAGTTRKFGGTGLGLAICRNLARAMGGDVRVESVCGEGASFILDLPLIPASAPETVSVAPGQKALLILDRSPITRSMLRAVLEAEAGAVAFAACADEALERIRAGHVAQVLIDDATIAAEPDRDAALSMIAAAAAAAGAATSLLWPGTNAADQPALLATGIGQVIVKPIAAAALVAKMFGSYNLSSDHLVSPAA
ncbi:tetratricopeptide repeat-containing sensor histidine kinase [Sphingomonas hylomeconis]|uniref:histidine kinase n=1 Tax=Sphingomonas hylomeconis TaxID=1395958 RepID=A0ABV7SX83_9SPHN|nr:ATP-binding protein [Sphingomonas hylomeconis]